MYDIATVGIEVNTRDVVNASRDLDKLSDSSKKTENNIGILEKRFKNFSGTMKAMTFAAVTAGITATSFALKKSIELFSGFEKELANVSTLVDTSVVSMGKLRKELLGLDANLGSTTELTRGLYQALSAGVDSAKAVAFLGEAAQAAKAGLSDAFTAVDAGTTLLNAFGIASEKAGFVFDLMFTTVKEGKTTFPELASSIGRISPIAAAANVSITEMHAALATLTKGGFATSEASSRLATALGTIIKPSGEAAELAERLGFEFNATALKAKGLQGFLQSVTEATGGSIDQMALLFGGMESLSVMLALTGKQSQEFTDILQRMGDVSGATKEAFDKQKVTLGALWDTFKNTIGRQSILLGESLAPTLKRIVDGMTDWVTANDKLIGQITSDVIGVTTNAVDNLSIAIKILLPVIKVFGTGLIVVHGTLDAIARSLAGIAAAAVEASKTIFASPAVILDILEASGLDSIAAMERAATRVNELWKDAPKSAAQSAQVMSDAIDDAVRSQVDAIFKVAEAAGETGQAIANLSGEQIEIQNDFVKEYKRLVLSTEDFELDSLKTQVEAFREAKVNETQLEEWMQNEIRNIKLRAQNEALALYEELAKNNSFYAQKAIEIMSEILDAEERKWAQILKDDDAAHRLRIQREEEYRDKVFGVIDDIVDKNMEAAGQIARESLSSASAGLTTKAPTTTPGGGGGVWTEDRVGGVVFINNRQGAIAYAQELKDIRENVKQIAAAAAEESARIAQQASEEAAQRAIDIAKQRVDLEIQILEATGYATEALGIRRMQELELMDESLRPLQQRLYYLEDETKAAAAAAEASASAAKAMENLVNAQNESIKVFESSISTLVSQGQAIRDFVNSLGTTGVSLSLSAARGAYMADLAGAKAGDPTAYGRITQSAGAFISTAGQTAGSTVEMARIVADIRRELLGLEPVVDLESNIELLKAIKKATIDTATSVDKLDILGIKAIFDLEQTLTLVDNSQGLPDHLKEMIVNQAGDYKLWLQAQLDESVSEDFQRILIDGAGIYATTVTAVAGAIDDESHKLAITALGNYQTTVNAALGIADADTRKLALTTANTYLTTVNAALGSVDATARELALTAANTINTTVNAGTGRVDPTAMRLVLKTSNTINATVNAALGEVNATAQELGLRAANTLASTVTVAFGFKDPDAIILATKAANDLAATVTAALGIGNVDALKLATKDVNSLQATVTAALAQDANTQQLANMLKGVGLTTTVDGTMTWNPNDPLKSVWEAIKAQTKATQVATENTAKGVKYSYLPYMEESVWKQDTSGWGGGTGHYETPSGKRTNVPGMLTWYQRVDNYATGGVFTNGIVTQPTMFNPSQMGEAGPEAIMPLVRGPQGLGVRSAGDTSKEQNQLLKQLLAEIRAGNFQISKNTGKVAKILTNFDFDGMPAERETA